MGLFLDAANAWNNLLNTKYYFLLTKKGKQAFEIELSFLPGYFPHLCGMHYAKDVDFGRNSDEYYGEKLIPALLNNLIDGSLIEKSQNYKSKIEGRLKAIKAIENTLDNDFNIAKFNPKLLPVFSKITADYVIKNVATGEEFFVFLDDCPSGAYCKSAFEFKSVDYLMNQPRLTVLKKVKTVNGQITLNYVHPHYDSSR